MRKVPTALKDGLVGLGIGAGAIIPGVSGATIALVFGSFKKIVNAVRNLFSKDFVKNLLILLPFVIGAILAVAGLIVPFQLAFEHCMFAIVCLFAAFIVGSFPSIIDNVRGEKPRPICIVVLVIGVAVAAMLGISSLIFKYNVQSLFDDPHWYLYVILFFLGILCASGLTVPGFSASMLLLAIGFYVPILNLFHFDYISANPGQFFGLVGVFALGVIIGFVLFSFLMNYLLDKHPLSTHYAIMGFVGGSLISIFVNTQMFDYLKTKANILDWVLAPIFIIIGITLAFLLVHYARKSKTKVEEEENA